MTLVLRVTEDHVTVVLLLTVSQVIQVLRVVTSHPTLLISYYVPRHTGCMNHYIHRAAGSVTSGQLLLHSQDAHVTALSVPSAQLQDTGATAAVVILALCEVVKAAPSAMILVSTARHRCCCTYQDTNLIQGHKNYRNCYDWLHGLTMTLVLCKVILFSLRIGHNRLTAHMYGKFKVGECEMWPCNAGIMTAEHLLQHCQLHDALRRDMWPEQRRHHDCRTSATALPST